MATPTHHTGYRSFLFLMTEWAAVFNDQVHWFKKIAIHDLAYSRITTYNWMTMKPFIFLSQELVNHLNHRQLLFIHSKSKNDSWFITSVKIRSQFSKFSKYFYRNCCSHMFYRIAILKFSTRQKKTLAMKTLLA